MVRDYCQKASLYDILEKGDLKIDDMYIASFVEDLLKVRGKRRRGLNLSFFAIPGHDLLAWLGAQVSWKFEVNKLPDDREVKFEFDMKINVQLKWELVQNLKFFS